MGIEAPGLIKWAEVELERCKIRNARQESEQLFIHSFGSRREDIYLNKDFKLSTDRIAQFRQYVKQRSLRYPLQYILKNTEFMGLQFLLEEGVFIPRPETEILIEKILEYIKSKGKKMNIFEIGTGCGNIAISLAKNATGCRLMASDISDKVLELAAKNALLHGMNKHIKFVRSNFFDNIPSHYYNYFDIIISNPPYIRRKEIKYLEPELSCEDIVALDGGEDGLEFYRRILEEGIKYLKEGGIFAFEIGYGQSEDIIRLYQNANRFNDIVFFKDYNGYDRVAIVQV